MQVVRGENQTALHWAATRDQPEACATLSRLGATLEVCVSDRGLHACVSERE